jgi:hypothetical protein
MMQNTAQKAGELKVRHHSALHARRPHYPTLHCMPALHTSTKSGACILTAPDAQQQLHSHACVRTFAARPMHALIMLVPCHLQDQAAQKAGETKEAAKVRSLNQNQSVPTVNPHLVHAVTTLHLRS